MITFIRLISAINQIYTIKHTTCTFMLKNKEKELLEVIKSKFVEERKYPSFSELQDIMGYASKRSIAVLIESLVEKGELKKTNGNIKLTKLNDSFNDDTVDVPLLGDVSCGIPIFADQNIDATISISTKYAKQGNKYFLLKAVGLSMNKSKNGNRGINEGDIVLVKVQTTARNNDWVVALVNNSATIKEFIKADNIVFLKPSSTTNDYQPMILHEEFKIQGVVVASFPDLL